MASRGDCTTSSRSVPDGTVNERLTGSTVEPLFQLALLSTRDHVVSPAPRRSADRGCQRRRASAAPAVTDKENLMVLAAWAAGRGQGLAQDHDVGQRLIGWDGQRQGGRRPDGAADAFHRDVFIPAPARALSRTSATTSSRLMSDRSSSSAGWARVVSIVIQWLSAPVEVDRRAQPRVWLASPRVCRHLEAGCRRP